MDNKLPLISYTLAAVSGICFVSGLVISYVGQETVGLKGSISNYCKDHNLDKSLFCSILRQLDFERDQLLKNIEN